MCNSYLTGVTFTAAQLHLLNSYRYDHCSALVFVACVCDVCVVLGCTFALGSIGCVALHRFALIDLGPCMIVPLGGAWAICVYLFHYL